MSLTTLAQPKPSADLVTSIYQFKAKGLENGTTQYVDYTLQTRVGFTSDDAILYIQGLSPDIPELWVKATRNAAGQYVIPTNQFMGSYDVGGYGFYIFDYYYTAVDAQGKMTAVVLTRDAQTGTLSTDQTVVLNGHKTKLEPYITFQGIQLIPFVEVPATPAKPSVSDYNGTGNFPRVMLTVPATDAEGNDLNIDKLFYTLWIEKNGQQQTLTLTTAQYERLTEDLTEIPYTFTDNHDIFDTGECIYLNQGASEIATWTKIGVQSIYYGGNEVRKSDIGWYDISPTGIAAILQSDVKDGTNGKFFENGRLVIMKNGVRYHAAGQRMQ